MSDDLVRDSQELAERLGDDYAPQYHRAVDAAAREAKQRRYVGADRAAELLGDPEKAPGTRAVHARRRVEPRRWQPGRGNPMQHETGAPTHFVLAPGEELPEGYDVLEEWNLFGSVLDTIRRNTAHVFDGPPEREREFAREDAAGNTVLDFEAARPGALDRILGHLSTRRGLDTPEIAAEVRAAFDAKDLHRIASLRAVRRVVPSPVDGSPEFYYELSRWPAPIPPGAQARSFAQLISDSERAHEVEQRYGVAYRHECYASVAQHAGRWIF